MRVLHLSPLLLVAAGAAGGQTFRLEIRHASGDTQVIETRVRFTLTAGKATLVDDRRVRYREEVLAASNGKRTRVRRHYLVHERTATTSRRRNTRRHPLHGRTVVLARAGEKTTIEPPVPGLPRIPRLGSPYDRLLPPAAVPVGHAWKVEGKTLARAWPLAAEGGRLSLRLEKVEQSSAGERATIALDGIISGRSPGVRLQMNLSGRLLLSLSARRIVSARLAGKATLIHVRRPHLIVFTGPVALEMTSRTTK